MTDREMLIELLAIKIFEHSVMADGRRHNMSWAEQDPEDRQNVRNEIAAADTPDVLYKLED